MSAATIFLIWGGMALARMFAGVPLTSDREDPLRRASPKWRLALLAVGTLLLAVIYLALRAASPG